MTTGIQLPLEIAALLCAGCALVGGWLGHRRTVRRLDPRQNPLRDLLKRENLGQAIDLARHRDAARQASHAVLHGRINQFAAGPGAGWSLDTCEQVREHVAAVMRVGLRRQDRIALGTGEFDADGFTIIIPGADERAAVRIANRLRRTLSQLRLPQLGHDMHLTASFGVAADRFGESDDGLHRRARRALDAAVAQGMDNVVPASEIEEILLLPSPSPSPSPSDESAASAA